VLPLRACDYVAWEAHRFLGTGIIPFEAVGRGDVRGSLYDLHQRLPGKEWKLASRQALEGFCEENAVQIEKADGTRGLVSASLSAREAPRRGSASCTRAPPG
jgi:hypothetical protein